MSDDNLGQPYGSTLTILNRTKTGKDTQGNATYSWAAAGDVPSCVVWPRTSSEAVQGQDMVIIGLNVLLPAGYSMTATQRARLDGIDYEVDGEPGTFTNPIDGTRAGCQVALTRVEG